MSDLEKMIDSGPLLNIDAIRNKIVNLSARKRIVMRNMKMLNQFHGDRFDCLYAEWKSINSYLTFFKELKNSL